MFTSKREKNLWLWALVIITTIFSTLFIWQPLLQLFGSQNIQAAIFVLGMLLIGLAILSHALKSGQKKVDIAIVFGVAAVYVLFFFRLGLAERSHIMEYSVLAILIHKAILERLGNRKPNFVKALIAFCITFIVSLLDEGLQLIIPSRVFDFYDIAFNAFAIASAITIKLLFLWMKFLKKTS